MSWGGIAGWQVSVKPAVNNLPIKKRSASQAAKDRAALKRLQKSGKYRGKIDLRKAPTKRQRELIQEQTRKRGKGSKQPLPPKQKVPGAKITRKRITEAQTRAAKPEHGLTTYALPFLRKGQSEPEWRRFTVQQLRKFLAEYKAGDEEGAAEWRSYAVKETWTFTTKTERTDFRRETDYYFSGVRIDEPQGKIRKQRKTKGHSKAGTKRAARKRGAK